MNLVLAVGLMIVIGFLGGLASAKLKFPMITGYIIIGVFLSPSLLNIIPREIVGELDIITNVALGIIAYMIGGGLHWVDLQKLAKSITWIVPFESLGAWFLVTLVLAISGPLIIPNETFWQTYFPMAFVIGAISCATAPAATMAIISEYRAKGPFITTLLAVVGLDDAIAVMAFAIASGISLPLVNTAESISLYQMLGIPFIYIVESISIGIVFAIVLMYMIRLARTRELLLVVVFGMIILCTGVSTYLGLSLILANMVAGFIIINKVKRRELFDVVEEIEDLVYVIFFVLAGLHFDLSVMKSAGMLAILIVITRCLGKYIGVRAGARISHAPDNVKKYLGFALLPKAGVTVGLVLLASIQFPTFGVLMLNAVLASTIINELIAPPLTKYAIFKAGEAKVDQL
ncbi:MAG: cation:proton antiporter [Euryarchaeota archaeon]|nr:cation:proton antiporter [Euryarchaeota archaeon]